MILQLELNHIGRYGYVANVSYQQTSTDICQQYLLIKATTLLFCTECSETQLTALSLINAILCPFLTVCSSLTTSSSA